MNHASTISCNERGVRVAFSDNCTLDEYGDPYDTMGHDGQRHFNTWHRWQMGALTTADVQTVTATGVYNVAPAEAAGGVPRVLRVARPSGNYFYLEYRQPYGRYDNFSSTAAVVNGVSIRLAAGVGNQSFSKLIDTNPQTATYSDSALAVGRGFADKGSNIFIVTQALSPSGATVLVQVGPDLTLPTAPTNLQTTVGATGAVALSWSAATDDLFVSTYRVSRDGTPLGSAYGTTYTDAAPPQAASHAYSVSAVDGAGNVGPQVSGAIVFVPDTTRPGGVSSLSATAVGPHSVVLAWAAASDNVGVTGYALSRGGQSLATVTGTSFTDDLAPDGYGLSYQVRALDAAGNVGPAATAGISLTDVTAPVLNGDLQLSVEVGGAINLSWPAATDNVGIVGYALTRGGTPLTTVTGTTHVDAGLAQAMDYGYQVVALDAAGNPSSPALSGTIYLPDSTAPSPPGALIATQSGPRAVDLHWAAATDNVGVDHYAISVDGVAATTTSAIELVALAMSDGVAHHFELNAVDAAGNLGQPVSADLTLPDVTAPSPVGTFGARASGATSVALSWTGATDNVAVNAYQLTRDGLPLVQLDASARGFTDTGLASDRQHTYGLVAIDAAGNTSTAATAIVRLSSADVAPPTVPQNLQGVALGSRRVSLTWSASSDDRPGTIRYRVFRGSRRIATVTTAGYVDRPASVGWYRYRVKAVDAAGNVSAFSVWVEVRATR
jgi:fibronectin type 3 domain-containing protein